MYCQMREMSTYIYIMHIIIYLCSFFGLYTAAAFFGQGVYFAVEAGYSAQEKYAVPDSSGLQHMFVCRMIVGQYTQGKQGMKTAPPLSADSTEVFDSLVNDVTTPTIFVAMTDAQAYPEYLITFKKLK